jgi:hypothetical protein
MPAKWPLFINNVSAKLIARSAKSMGLPPNAPGIGDFASFLADEYVAAVSTAQTPFGNTHSNAGVKAVLAEGFDKAFKKLFEDYETSLEDRKILSQYQSITEILPESDLTFDAQCEIEKWTSENTDTLQKFNYYPLYKSTCPVPYPEEDPNDTTNDGDIDFSVVTKASSDINAPSHNYVVRFIIKKFNPEQSFKIRYTINEIEQPLLSIGSVGSGAISQGTGSGSGRGAGNNTGFTVINVPAVPGKYTYTFKEILDISGKSLIKTINKTKSITISDGGVLEKLSGIDEKLQGDAAGYPENITKPIRNTIPDLTEEEKIDVLVNRILIGNDNSKAYKKWVDLLKYGTEMPRKHRALSEKIYNKIKKLEKAWRRVEWEKRKKLVKSGANSYSLTSSLILPPLYVKDNQINQYVFQEEHKQRPEEITEEIQKDLIKAFTYVPSIDGNLARYTNTSGVFWRRNKKESLYKKEQERWWETQRKWANYMKEINSQDQGEDGEDPYEIMAGAIIKYWQSAAAQPFTSGPPIPPCNITAPLLGVFAPIYYGSKTSLANDLRRAWNNGKIFEVPPATPVAATLVATAVAGACAKHLLKLKFLYLGGISTPGGPIPMVGFMPLSF